MSKGFTVNEITYNMSFVAATLTGLMSFILTGYTVKMIPLCWGDKHVWAGRGKCWANQHIGTAQIIGTLSINTDLLESVMEKATIVTIKYLSQLDTFPECLTV